MKITSLCGDVEFIENFTIPCIPCILWFILISHVFLLIGG